MEVKLRVLGGKNAGQELGVPGPKFVIGRAEGCQLRARSDAIAERHCELEVGQALVRISDLGSATGTFVNNERITAPRDLKSGDRLKIGPLEFEVTTSVKMAAKKKPKVQSIGEAAARLAAGGPEDLDLDQLLAEGDSAPQPSRYAAKLSDDELESMGLKPKSDNAAAQPKPAAAASESDDETRQAAEDLLKKYYKNR